MRLAASYTLTTAVNDHGSEQNKQVGIPLDASAGVLCRWSRARVSIIIITLIDRLYDAIPSASGFTTRSDIGPAREGPSAEAIACVSLVLLDSVIVLQSDRCIFQGGAGQTWRGT